MVKDDINDPGEEQNIKSKKYQGKVKRVQMTEEDVERLKGYEQNTICLTETKF